MEITPELRREGLSRELVNRIQNLRKSSDFEVTDRIDTVVYADDPDLADALAAHGEYIKAQTLSRTLVLRPAGEAPAGAPEVEWIDKPINIIITR